MSDSWQEFQNDFFKGDACELGQAKLAAGECKMAASCPHAPRQSMCRICMPAPRSLAHSGVGGTDLPDEEPYEAAPALTGGNKRERTPADKTADAIAARAKRRATREAAVPVSKRGRGKKTARTVPPPTLCSNDSRTYASRGREVLDPADMQRQAHAAATNKLAAQQAAAKAVPCLPSPVRPPPAAPTSRWWEPRGA